MASRTQNATRNILWGIANKLSALFIPFIVRTVMIYSLGSEYLGLNSLFTSILQVLSLAELGVGSAMVYAMYKPVAENDTETICALLNLYRTMYRIIGLIIVAAGLILMPFLRYFISGDIPDNVNLYFLFIIYIINTAGSYFLYGYQVSILNAHQRNDISSKVFMVISTLKSLLQILILLFFKSYYAYVILVPVTTITANIITAHFARKLYPQYTCHGNISPELAQKIKGKIIALFAVKITTVIYNSVDSIVISAFLGLVVLAKYNNYYYIMNALTSIVVVIFSSITSTIGNSIITETAEKNYRDYMNLSFINAWIIGWFSICLFCLYQPFMKLWVGEELMFDQRMVLCFCMYFYVHQLKSVQSAYKDAAGLWKEDMWRSYAANIFNLCVNLILVQKIGVYGVLISTILALLVITYPWQTWMIHRRLFLCSMKPYLIHLGVYTLATLSTGLITFYLCSLTAGDGITAFILKILICAIIPNLVFLLLSFRTKEFNTFLRLLKRIVRRK